MKLKEVKLNSVYKLNADLWKSYGYSKGDRVVVTYKSGSQINVQDEERTKNAIGLTCTALDPFSYTKEELETELKEAQNTVDACKAKLKWMKDTKSEVFDEDEFKVWQVLETLDAKSSQVDKARAIAALIKN